MHDKSLIPISARVDMETDEDFTFSRKWFWSAILVGILLGLIFGQAEQRKPEPVESLLSRAGSYQDYVLPP